MRWYPHDGRWQEAARVAEEEPQEEPQEELAEASLAEAQLAKAQDQETLKQSFLCNEQDAVSWKTA